MLKVLTVCIQVFAEYRWKGNAIISRVQWPIICQLSVYAHIQYVNIKCYWMTNSGHKMKIAGYKLMFYNLLHILEIRKTKNVNIEPNLYF